MDASGKTISYNESRVEKHRTLRIASNYSNVPSKPPDNLVPFEYWHDGMQRLIRKVQELFEMRPVWTRRAVINHVQNFPSLGDIKYVFAYVGYEFLSGPWSNTIVKYGIDPRQDPKYRVYQSMTFHVAEEPRVPSLGAKEHKRGGARTKRSPGSASEQSQHATSHLFDGEGIDIQDGRSWQVCDITDPILKALLATGMLRSDCHVGTVLAKVHAALLTADLAQDRWLVSKRNVGQGEVSGVLDHCQCSLEATLVCRKANTWQIAGPSLSTKFERS